MHSNPHALTPDFSTQAYQRDLYAHYRRYLDDTPVFQNDEGVVYLTRYADCAALLSGRQFCRRAPDGSGVFAQGADTPSAFDRMIADWMIFMDPPRHDAVRKAFMPFFSTRVLKDLEPFVRRVARSLVDALPASGEVEILESFAFTLPVAVIAEIIGVPEKDFDLFRDWAMQLTIALDRGNPEDMKKGRVVALLLREYFSVLIADRRASSGLGMAHKLAADGNTALTADELLHGCAFLLWSGHETTKNLISNGIHILAERPDALALLRREPGCIEAAVEEMLRFETPVQKISRWTHEDAVFGSYVVPKGSLVTALLGAAHRDPAAFEQPDAFLPTRAKNRHLAFGTGIHHCLGAMLARLEARIAFEELLPRLHRLEPSRLRWRTFSAFRSMDELFVNVQLQC